MSKPLFSFEEVPKQAGARWFIRRGPKTNLMRGFKTKADASTWIDGLGHRLDWRVGLTFRLRGDTTEMSVVDRLGEEAKN